MNLLPVATQNGRKSTVDETEPEREWPHRLPYMVKHFRKIDPAVVGGQEFTVQQCGDLMTAFPNWTYAGGVTHGNCPVFWDTARMLAEEDTLLEVQFPSGKRERYLTLIRLQHRTLPWGAWFGSIHLAANGPDEPNSEDLRRQQMVAAVDAVEAHVAAHPHPEDGKANLVVCGDLNDNLGDNAGVRKVARDYGGWKPLRTRLKGQGDTRLDKFTGDTYRSFHGWGHKTSQLPHDSKALDEIFTSGVALDRAALYRTCRDVYPIDASDHSAYQAWVVMS